VIQLRSGEAGRVKRPDASAGKPSSRRHTPSTMTPMRMIRRLRSVRTGNRYTRNRRMAHARPGSLGDTSTLPDPAVVDDLIEHRQNEKGALA
jgi:hypothetical protein